MVSLRVDLSSSPVILCEIILVCLRVHVMLDIKSYHSFPGYGRKLETEKDVFFFLLTVLQESFTC